MPHGRQQIRHAWATRLTGLTYTGDRVYKSKIRPSSKAKVPNLNIWTKDDETDHELTTINYRIERQLLTIVEIRDRPTGSVPVDDSLDEIAAEVEAAVMTDPTFGGLVRSTIISSTRLDTSGEAERVTGLLTLVFKSRYIHYAADPTTLITNG